MAGYSGTPLPKKLGIKPGHRVAVLGAPPGFALDVPEADVVSSLRGKQALDVVVLFTKKRATLDAKFDAIRARMSDACGFWVAWPKKSSGVATDLNEDLIRVFALASGLVDNKVCAIDDTWSGLRLVIRLRDRGK